MFLCKRMAVLTVAAIGCWQLSWSATYYVRTDGGDSAQCTGLADAPYPGSGAAQPCAFNHPAWAIGGQGGTQKMAAGDTLILSQEQYMIGYGMPNNPNGSVDWTYDSTLQPIPSGIDASHPTKIYGKGWDTGCAGMKAQLWGTERAWQVLTVGSNTEVQCLEITDHSACIENGPQDGTVDGFPVKCVRDTYPHGPWASNGLLVSDGSGNIHLTQIDIHGLATRGLFATHVGDMNLQNTRIVANGFVGWDSDGPSADDSYTGTVTLDHSKIEWNGCGERYPLTTQDLSTSADKHHCWSQDQGGYGDGIGLGDGAPGNWTFLDSSISWNTSDGVDLVHGDGSSTTKFIRSRAEGNAGNQFKTTGIAYVENSILIGNCSFFNGQPFTSNKGSDGSTVGFNHCRAMGNTTSFNFPLAGNYARISNSTLLSNGDVMVLLGASAGCSGGNPRVYLYNNIIYGGDQFGGAGDLTALWYTESPCQDSNLVEDYNLIYHSKNNNAGCNGAHDLCGQDPKLAGTIQQDAVNYSQPNYWQQLKLQPSSPVLGAADLSILLTGSSNDFLNTPRGAAWDLGAYEYTTATAAAPAPPRHLSFK